MLVTRASKMLMRSIQDDTCLKMGEVVIRTCFQADTHWAWFEYMVVDNGHYSIV